MKKSNVVREEHLLYLDQIERLGETHMSLAGPLLQELFPELTEIEANQTLKYWFEILGQRQYEYINQDINIEKLNHEASFLSEFVKALAEKYQDRNLDLAGQEKIQALLIAVEEFDTTIEKIESLSKVELGKLRHKIDMLQNAICLEISNTDQGPEFRRLKNK